MTLLRYFSPIRAYRDLRFFLATRRRHEVWFLLLSLAITVTILWMFVKDSHFEKPYERNIVYVEQWPLTRTDEQIKAQQKIDQAKRNIERAELEKKQAKRRAEFKKVDDALTRWGF